MAALRTEAFAAIAKQSLQHAQQMQLLRGELRDMKQCLLAKMSTLEITLSSIVNSFSVRQAHQLYENEVDDGTLITTTKATTATHSGSNRPWRRTMATSIDQCITTGI
eukprot:GILI01048537.1.p1 GENE.GILI01048537.1~~GILI01048537.1.p1  ORF type:complete len:108 (+),score=9.91 GILI01048537.1:73-396(+)